jgi:hypothetical protein
MLTRFNQAMEPVKKRWKQHGHLFLKPKDSVNVATKSKEEIARLTAKTIAQKFKDAGVPTDLCWGWYTTGECSWPSCVRLNCKNEPQYLEEGKVYRYCGITCAAEAETLTESKQLAKLSNNAMIQEEDDTWMDSNYMALAGFSHVEISEAVARLGFVSGPVSPAEVASVYLRELSDLQTMGSYQLKAC